MQRRRLFTNTTSRRTLFLLWFGLAMIYIASVFVYSIYEYGNRFKPNPALVREDFVHVVKLTQAVSAPLRNEFVFYQNSLVPCILSDNQLQGRQPLPAKSADCSQLLTNAKLADYKEITSFSPHFLRSLQEQHVGQYRFKVRLKQTWLHRERLINNFVRIMSLAQGLSEHDKRLRYMRNLGFDVTVSAAKPERASEIKDMRTDYLKQFAQKNLLQLNAYRELDSGRYLLVKYNNGESQRVDNFVRALLLTRDNPEKLENLRYIRDLGFSVKIQSSQPTDAQSLDDLNIDYLNNFAQANKTHLDAYRKLDDGSYLVVRPDIDHDAPMWLLIGSPPHYNPHPPVVMFGFYSVAGVFLLAIIILCAWAIRRVSFPVNKLLLAARRFGRDLQAPPMAVEGSREMCEVIVEYNNMQEKIRRLVQDRTQMLAAISHDLRTPITRLLMRIEYLQGSPQYEKAVTDLKQMDQMIRSILSFAREYASNEAMERFDLGALLESICSDLQDTNLAVDYISPEIHQVFFGRVTALKRAFSNIIENAVKYGDHATVSFEVLNREVIVKVKDKGPGIPELEMEKVFEPFYRVDPARNPEKGGSGLGMAVSRDIVRSHAGDIKLYNSDQEGEGLVVVIHLPMAD